MSMTRPQRPPLFDRLKTALEQAIEWEKGNGTARVTVMEDGERIVGPVEMTKAEFDALHTQTEEGTYLELSPSPVTTTFLIVEGVIADYDAEGQLVGIRVTLNARPGHVRILTHSDIKYSG